MGRIIEKIVAALLVIIVLTFLINHGKLDFSGVDFVATKTKDVINSEEGQEIIAELKDISVDVIGTLTDEVKNLISKSKNNKEKQEVTLVSVIDGDTLLVSIDGTEIKVRLIGIDTPESVHADVEQNNIYGTYASDHTKTILSGVSTLFLEFDEETEDQYGRVLAYVWLQDEESTATENIGKYMLNGIILKDGYAMDKMYEPNDKYATNFMFLRKEASAADAGLWQYEEFEALWQ